MPERAASRPFDVVLWGATGFTGRHLAIAFAEAAPAGLRWAIGGRDEARLVALREGLGADVGIVLGDALDPESMRTLARSARVVLSTAGPYARYGTALVDACVTAGSDYADVTGETLWMRASIDAFDERARASGSRIVHACGFDSVPSDLGTWLLQRTAVERHGAACDAIDHVFGPLEGGLGGGTVASAFEMLETAAADPLARRALRDPNLLAPGAPPAAPLADPWWPLWDQALGCWTAPFVMAAVNTRVVRRSATLSDEPWAAFVRYRERWRAPHWPAALAVGLATRAAPIALAAGPLRRWLRGRLPAAGQGPSDEALARGGFRSRLTGRFDDRPETLSVTIASDRDPGYGATVRMLREVGLALADGTLDAPGGVHTPVSVGAERLLGRMPHAGVRFEVVSAAPS